MFQYIIKRILIFVPTFFAISLIIFGLSKMAPGDPVEVMVTGSPEGGRVNQTLEMIEESYLIQSKKLGLDKPSFYFSFTSSAYPNDLHKIVKKEHRELVNRLISKYGNSDAVKNYYYKIRKVINGLSELTELEENFNERRFVRDKINELLNDYNETTILYKLNALKKNAENYSVSELSSLKKTILELNEAFSELLKNATPYKLYIPKIHIYGIDNQYHTWMFGDYPWFVKVDSTNYKKLESLYAEIAVLNIKQDSLFKIQKPYLAVQRRVSKWIAENDSTKQFKRKQIDSLNIVLTTSDSVSRYYDSLMNPLKNELALLSTEKDSFAKDIKMYTGKGFLRGDFGYSYANGLPVTKRLTDAVFWTLLMNFFSILVSYFISIPLGVQSAYWKKNGERFEPLLSTEAFFAAAFIVTLMYFYLSNFITFSLFNYGIIGVNLLYFILLLWKKERANHGSFSYAAILRFWKNLLRFKMLNLADNTLLILRLLYVWIWAILFFLFILLPLILKIILISLPIALWGIKKLRKKVTEKTNNYNISLKGIYAKGSFVDNMTTTVLFILYSLPSFWIGTLLIVFFTTKSYGVLYDWFPTGGVQSSAVNDPDATFISIFFDRMYHLFLPTFCITISSFAYLSRQMRGAMLGVLRQDYIRTANSKGLSEHKVVWKHAFRNSLFPIITLFSSVFPRALSGAIAIELIYNIPGMGVLVLKAIGERDWPVVFTVAMLAAILTMIGNLIADILYALVDPRISFK